MDTQPLLKGLAEARNAFTRMLDRTPDDRLEWTPDTTTEGKPTSTLDIIRHLIASDVDMKQVIAEGVPSEWDPSDMEASFRSGPAADVTDRARLLQILEETGKEVDAAFEALPEERWGETLELPFGSMSVAAFAWMLVAHWYYHCGQIAYLQRCWGDVGM
ncbi:MAG: DinB family protein [Armatimonadota bacterium]